MFCHNPGIARVELNHGRFATASEVKSLKTVLALEMHKRKATRAVLRVLTDRPARDDGFGLEACAQTGYGNLACFGFNSPSRQPSVPVIEAELKYVAGILCQARRPPSGRFDIVRLEKNAETAAELEALYSRTYARYPVPLDRSAVSARLESDIPYAVVEGGRIVSALFGSVFRYGPLTAVEFTLSATRPSRGGLGMTAELARRIREEAVERFRDPLMVAETLAGPVMRSCHDLGMYPHGVLPEHYEITIGNRTYTNFYAWFL
jgi:hypothetical protein